MAVNFNVNLSAEKLFELSVGMLKKYPMMAWLYLATISLAPSVVSAIFGGSFSHPFGEAFSWLMVPMSFAVIWLFSIPFTIAARWLDKRDEEKQIATLNEQVRKRKNLFKAFRQ